MRSSANRLTGILFTLILILSFSAAADQLTEGFEDEESPLLTLDEYCELSGEEYKTEYSSVKSWGNRSSFQYPWWYGPLDVRGKRSCRISIESKAAGRWNTKPMCIFFFRGEGDKDLGESRWSFPISPNWKKGSHQFAIPEGAVELKIGLRLLGVEPDCSLFCDDLKIELSAETMRKNAESSGNRQTRPVRNEKPLLTYTRPAGLPVYGTFPSLLKKAADQNIWLREQQEEIISNAEYWLKISDEEIWNTMPGQEIPRLHWANRKDGCPTCGSSVNSGYGYYYWGTDPVGHPWKVQCPKCKDWFPKNDFRKYYLSGIGDNGRFDEKKADKKLLYNTEHPNPSDPKHTWAVDSGAGWIDKNGSKFGFIGTYVMQAYWGRRYYPTMPYSISTGAQNLAYAYLFTGNKKYALKAAIILSRLSSLYRDYDYLVWSEEYKFFDSRIPGKILDYIWENIIAEKFIKTYAIIADTVKDDHALNSFLVSKKNHLGLGAQSLQANLFIELVELKYLRELFAEIKIGNVCGNIGMHELIASLVALTTYDTVLRDEVLKWLFAPAITYNAYTADHISSGAGMAELVFSMTRDGFSWESGGYCNILPDALTSLIAILGMYSWIDTKGALGSIKQLYNERLSRYYCNKYDMQVLDIFHPDWGDSGAFCWPRNRGGLDPTEYINGYLLSGNENIGVISREILATPELIQNIKPRWHNLFYLTPDSLPRLAGLTKPPPPRREHSLNLTGRGMVILKSGEGNTRRALFTHYGNNHDLHNHQDTLGLQLFAYGRNVMPHLGYPDNAKQDMLMQWHHSAIQNNLVVVDTQSPLRLAQIADQKMFADGTLASVCDIDALAVYPSLSRYRRIFALVNISPHDFYVVDFFEVAGGKEHIYSFHSGGGKADLPSELRFEPQSGGTYAGPDIPYGTKPVYEEPADEQHRYGNGFSWLENVHRSTQAQKAQTIFHLDNTHDISPFGNKVTVALTMLTPFDEMALADGKPTENFKGNPPGIPYILTRRTGQGEDFFSDFNAVIECFLENKRPVTSIRLLKKVSGPDFSSAVEVTLKDGRTDLIVRLPEMTSEAVFEGGLAVTGRFALLRLGSDKKVNTYMCAGTKKISFNTFNKTFVPFLKGTVEDFTKTTQPRCSILIKEKLSLPENAALPLWIDIHPVASWVDGNYQVLELRPGQKKGTELITDSGSFVHSPAFDDIKNVKKVSEMYKYEFEPGAEVLIPLVYEEKIRE